MAVVLGILLEASSYCVALVVADLCLLGIGRNSECDHDYFHYCERSLNEHENADCYLIVLAVIFSMRSQLSVLQGLICLARKTANANVSESGRDYCHGYVASQTQGAHMLRP